MASQAKEWDIIFTETPEIIATRELDPTAVVGMHEVVDIECDSDVVIITLPLLARDWPIAVTQPLYLPLIFMLTTYLTSVNFILNAKGIFTLYYHTVKQ